jgi:hypothetical protein
MVTGAVVYLKLRCGHRLRQDRLTSRLEVCGWLGQSYRGDIRMSAFARELFAYAGARKKWWLLPTLLVLIGVGGLLILAQGSIIAPFIYTVF